MRRKAVVPSDETFVDQDESRMILPWEIMEDRKLATPRQREGWMR
jgi:hypothetical protein